MFIGRFSKLIFCGLKSLDNMKLTKLQCWLAGEHTPDCTDCCKIFVYYNHLRLCSTYLGFPVQVYRAPLTRYAIVQKRRMRMGQLDCCFVHPVWRIQKVESLACLFCMLHPAEAPGEMPGMHAVCEGSGWTISVTPYFNPSLAQPLRYACCGNSQFLVQAAWLRQCLECLPAYCASPSAALFFLHEKHTHRLELIHSPKTKQVM